MKMLPLLLALACVGCAPSDQFAKDEVYHPPVYRTGSNIPSQGSSTGSSNQTDVSGESMRRSLPPPLVRKPPEG